MLVGVASGVEPVPAIISYFTYLDSIFSDLAPWTRSDARTGESSWLIYLGPPRDQSTNTPAGGILLSRRDVDDRNAWSDERLPPQTLATPVSRTGS
jgi:hypothetical protein